MKCSYFNGFINKTLTKPIKKMKKILLGKFFLLLMLITGVAFGQERTITGKVTSQEDGTGLPGVNVILKGTTYGTVTNVDGNYSLAVPASADGVLVFSFIGLTHNRETDRHPIYFGCWNDNKHHTVV